MGDEVTRKTETGTPDDARIALSLVDEVAQLRALGKSPEIRRDPKSLPSVEIILEGRVPDSGKPDADTGIEQREQSKVLPGMRPFDVYFIKVRF